MASLTLDDLIRVAPLILILIIIAVIGNRFYFSGTSQVGYPRAFLAQDAYWDLWRIDQIEEYGSINIQAKVLAAFHPENFTTEDGPILHYAVYWFAQLLNIENHVAVHVLLIFVMMMMITVIFILISKISHIWAWVSLPFMVVALNSPFISLINWGFWRSYFAIFIFFMLSSFYPFEFNWRRTIGFAILLGFFLVTHPFLAPYIIIILAFSIFSKPKNRLVEKILKFGTIGIISVVIFFDYFWNFLAYRYGAKTGSLESVLGFGKYTLYGADVTIKNLGFWWWLAIIGFVVALFFVIQNRKKIAKYNLQVIVVLLMIFLIYPLQYFISRLMQFRLTWPLLVGVFLGFLFYQIIQFIPKKFPKEIIGLIVFGLLLGVLNFSVFEFPVSDYAIISKDLWSGFIYVRDNSQKDSTVLLIDPIQSQGTSTLGTNRHLRFIGMSQFMDIPNYNYNLSKVETWRACQFPNWLRKETSLKKSKLGYGLEVNNLSDNLCLPRPVELCQNNYLILNYQFRTNEQVEVMKRLFAEIENQSFEVVFSRQTAVVLENKEPCGTWVPKYILK